MPTASSAPASQTPSTSDWYRLPAAAVLQSLGSTGDGLSSAEAGHRLAAHGPNELIDRGSKAPLRILWEQLTAVMVLILVAAAGLSLVLGKFIEAGSIGAIVILFALLGVAQEYRAERAITALRQLSVPVVRVRRDGVVVEVPATRLVPGDVVILQAGGIVPADVRLLESASLRIQEAALTGESEPVEKLVGPIDTPELALGDRRNMGYMGTQIVHGRGVGVVVATGMSTELGRIAELLQSVRHDATPLQRRLDSVGKQLAVAGAVAALILVAVGLLSDQPLSGTALTAISVAVAVIPEGLPAVVTFTLALGAQRMLRRNALIRKLPAVETLGSVTVICSDKTGTLTENRMTVTVAQTASGRAEVAADSDLADDVRLLLAAGALCSDAELSSDDAGTVLGDPTEGAFLVAARRAGMPYGELRAAYPRLAEVPFDADRKRMTTVHAASPAEGGPTVLPAALADGAPYLAIVKGAPDCLLELSSSIWDGDCVRHMDTETLAAFHAANEDLASQGIRVLAVGCRPLPSPGAGAGDERDLTMLGLVGMIDPPRPAAKTAVATCLAAGIRPVMITGDHPLTATAIAGQLGLDVRHGAITGPQLEAMTGDQLAAAARETAVFARVSPEHKLRLIEALQSQGDVVAMTGDGVNDAPALRRADIGVAMGITGTDVSKEASDMVLLDDNFATIVAAVEEGRVIYDNLRRFVSFAVAGNIAKVMVMVLWPAVLVLAAGSVTEAGAALLPLQLLWLNLMTDGLLGLSMGVEPAERGVMGRKPHNPASGIFSDGLGTRTAVLGLVMGTVALSVGTTYFQLDQPEWQTMMFMTLASLQVFQAVAVRSHDESVFERGLFGNRVMAGIVAAVIGLQLLVLYVPPLAEDFLRVEPLGPGDLLLCIAAGSLALATVEVEKAIRARGAGSVGRGQTHATARGHGA